MPKTSKFPRAKPDTHDLPNPRNGHAFIHDGDAASHANGLQARSTQVEAEIIVVIASKRGAWSASDLAELLGCSDKHIYELAKSGRMPHLRIDGMIRFDPSATAAWLRERYVAA